MGNPTKVLHALRCRFRRPVSVLIGIWIKPNELYVIGTLLGIAIAVGSVVVSADRPPSVQRISELRDRVIGLNVPCVLSEPQFDSGIVASVTENADAWTGVVDPLGSTIDTGPDLYFDLMRNMAGSIKNCLEPGSGSDG